MIKRGVELSQLTSCGRLEQTKINRFMLEGPGQCTIFCFVLSYILAVPFLLVSSSGTNHDLLCFVRSQGQKREQKH